MRALAVSSEEPSELLPEVPTITDAGYELVLTNWRGLLAPSDISDAERQALIELVTEAHDSDAWAQELDTRGWSDAFLVGDEFTTYVEENVAEVTDTLKNIGLVD